IIPNSKPKKITVKNIMKFIAEQYNVTVEEILSRKRTKTIAYPRQVAMYLSRELTDLSLPKIGQEFGNRDHTTVIHAHKKIIKTNKKVLINSIQAVSNAISARTVVPILTGMKLDVKNNSLILTGSNSDITIQSHIPSVKDEQEIITEITPGSIVLPVPHFPEI